MTEATVRPERSPRPTPNRTASRVRRIGKPVVWAACLAPIALLVWRGWTDDLGAEPVEEVLHATGWWALALLTTTLGISPLRRWSGWNSAVQFRRLLGLFAFFYATLHVGVWVGLETGPDLAAIVEEVVEHPFVTVGAAAYLLMVPLAATSTQGSIRRLGKRWQRLHRLVYPTALLAGVHFLWSTKVAEVQPLLFAVLIAGLLLLRTPWLDGRRHASRARREPRGPREPRAPVVT